MATLADTTLSKMKWRLLPFLLVCYLLAYLDRVNVSIAALQMNEDLGFTPTIYAFGGGIFFLGYFLFELPSNWALERVGARRWIARIMISWGLVASAMAFVSGPTSFYWLRFLLGAAEAGFLPGIVYYLSRWFPARERAAIMALFFLGLPLSFVVGAPVSGALLSLDGLLGIAGWKWLYLLEGLPTVVFGILCLKVLTDRPSEAKWLSAEERNWIEGVLRAEEAERAKVSAPTFTAALYDRRVWAFGIAYVGIIMGMYGIGLWLPQIIKQLGYSDFVTSTISAVPYVLSAVAMIVVARSSDRTGERRWHAVLPCIVAAAGLVASAYIGSPLLSLAAVTVGAVAVISSMPTFWALPTAVLSGSAAAGGIALINSIGNLGGFAGPYLVGYVREASGSFQLGLLFLAVCPFLTALILYAMTGRSTAEEALRRAKSSAPAH
ncbi:MFS transporter [Chelatococcus sp. GCM10030263]|uniref:MFS transporter n=1 Tax=Chelatococcus sp. GCM10030263 TaxID=3273387 RepID=UPI003618008D